MVWDTYLLIVIDPRKKYTTVDGRIPASVDMVNIPLFTRFYTSSVVQDFFHQQYDTFFVSRLVSQVQLSRFNGPSGDAAKPGDATTIATNPSTSGLSGKGEKTVYSP